MYWRLDRIVKMYSMEMHSDPQRLCVCHHQHIHQKTSSPSHIIKLPPPSATTGVPLPLAYLSAQGQLHTTLSGSGRTFQTHNCLYGQTHRDLHSTFSCSHCTKISNSTFTNLTSVCQQGVRFLECGMPTGGAVNNCHPESTQMPRVPLRSGPLQ